MPDTTRTRPKQTAIWGTYGRCDLGNSSGDRSCSGIAPMSTENAHALAYPEKSAVEGCRGCSSAFDGLLAPSYVTSCRLSVYCPLYISITSSPIQSLSLTTRGNVTTRLTLAFV